MYNANMPSNEELPSTAKLIKSTILALVVAGILLVTVVMPAEYGIDPTGVGKALGLTSMGKIKHSLAHEAEADAKAHVPSAKEFIQQAAQSDESDKSKPEGHYHQH